MLANCVNLNLLNLSKKRSKAIKMLFHSVCISILLTIAVGVQELQMVIQNSRHGARSAISPDLFNYWPYPGELTGNGMREHFVLGKEIRNRYGNLLPAIYDPKLFNVRSTMYNRTVQSIHSQLYGAFTDGNEQNAPQMPQPYDPVLAYPPLMSHIQYSDFGNSALPNNYTPIPVHVSETKYDQLLKGYQGKACPIENLLWEGQKNAIVTEKQSFIEEAKPLIKEAIANKWIESKDPNTFDTLSETAYMFDTIKADLNSGKPIPFYPNSSTWKKYEYLYNVFHHYMYNGNPVQYQLGSSIYLNDVLNTLINKTKGLRSEKYIIHSSHDSNLVSILSAFNILNVTCFESQYKNPKYNNSYCVFPSYASTLFFELWADPNNLTNASVKVKYDEQVLPLCSTKDDSCDLNSFAKVIQKATNNYSTFDYYQICNYGLPPQPTPTKTDSTRSLLALVALGLLIAIGFAVKRQVYDTWKEETRKNQNLDYIRYQGH